MKTLFLIIIPLLVIDLFLILYKGYKKIELKKINSYEEKIGIDEDKYTSIEKITKKKTIVVYIIGTIFVIIYLNFINKNIYESTSFLSMLKTEFSYILLIFVIYLSICTVFKYIKGFVEFFIGFKKGITSKNDDLDN